MRGSIATIFVTFYAAVSQVAVAFTVTRKDAVKLVQHGRLQQTEILALPRIPFLQRKSDQIEVMDAPTETEPVDAMSVVTAVDQQTEPTKVLSETEKLLKQVKEAGLAGVVSYALWELGFWTVSVPVVLFGYYEVTGHWPDLSDQTDIAKLSAEAFAFVNFARFAVPLRIGLALSTTPWIQSNIVDRFMKKDDLGTTANE